MECYLLIFSLVLSFILIYLIAYMLLQTCTQENPQLVKNILFTVPSKIRVFDIYYSVHFVTLQVYFFSNNSFSVYFLVPFSLCF